MVGVICVVGVACVVAFALHFGTIVAATVVDTRSMMSSICCPVRGSRTSIVCIVKRIFFESTSCTNREEIALSLAASSPSPHDYFMRSDIGERLRFTISNTIYRIINYDNRYYKLRVTR